MATQRGDQRAGRLLVQLVKAGGRIGPSPLHRAQVVLAPASSRSRYRSGAAVARSVISRLAVAADVV